MNHIRHSKNTKELSTAKNAKRRDLDVIDQRTRVIQKNLVFAHGLPLSLNNKDTLKNDIHFGRYGKISKIIVNSGQSHRKATTCHVYVTYQTEFQASLAIVALDGYNLNQKPLKVSYGTNKYCSSFIKGYECSNPDCYYLHKLDQKREVKNGEFRNAFKEQNDDAFDIVSRNLDFIVKKMSTESDKEEGFPTFTEMVDFLIQSNIVTKNQIQKAKKKLSPEKRSKMETPPKAVAEEHKEEVMEDKKGKRNSFSTVGSPMKFIEVEKTENVDKQVETEKSIEDETRTNSSFKLEETIEKMIIKRLFRTTEKMQRSKLNFVKSDKAHTDELLKLRSIIQKHLIASS